MNHKEIIKRLLRMTSRQGIESLIECMEQIGFYDAPCSSKYHLAIPGGLAKHSINVFRNAIFMAEDLYLKQDKPLTFAEVDSIVICSLLHDLGKSGQFGKPNYKMILVDDESTQCAESVTYKTNENLLYVPHEIRSIAIASRHIELTEEEQYAILYHNGLYGELKGFKGKETPLLLLLHHADMWAARVTEKEDKQ